MEADLFISCLRLGCVQADTPSVSPLAAAFRFFQSLPSPALAFHKLLVGLSLLLSACSLWDFGGERRRVHLSEDLFNAAHFFRHLQICPFLSLHAPAPQHDEGKASVA